jgi:hypothetical protein
VEPAAIEVLERCKEQAEEPGVKGRMRMTAKVDLIAHEDVADVGGMQRLNLGVLGLREIVNIVALNGHVQER